MMLSIVGIFVGIFLFSNVLVHSELAINIGYIVLTVSLTYLISFSMGTRSRILGNIGGIIISGVISFILVFVLLISNTSGSSNVYSYYLIIGLPSWAISSVLSIVATVIYNKLPG